MKMAIPSLLSTPLGTAGAPLNLSQSLYVTLAPALYRIFYKDFSSRTKLIYIYVLSAPCGTLWSFSVSFNSVNKLRPL